jgi:hypothetical protein
VWDIEFGAGVGCSSGSVVTSEKAHM